MAGKPAENDTPMPGSLTAPGTEELCRMVAAWAMKYRSAATACRIEIEHKDGAGHTLCDTVAVPLQVPLPDDLSERIVAVLGKLQSGQWLGGKALIAELDVPEMDIGSGSFRRAIAGLKGRIESNNNLGYRLAST